MANTQYHPTTQKVATIVDSHKERISRGRFPDSMAETTEIVIFILLVYLLYNGGEGTCLLSSCCSEEAVTWDIHGRVEGLRSGQRHNPQVTRFAVHMKGH